MFTEREKSHLLRLARQSLQARLDPIGSPPARLAWAYDLLDEATETAGDGQARSRLPAADQSSDPGDVR